MDYPNAGECFPGIELRGGVCYFLWDRDNTDICEYTNVVGEKRSTINRVLNEYPIFIRWNESLKIIKKVLSITEKTLTELVSSVSPFGISTSVRGEEKYFENSLKLYSSKGVGYVNTEEIRSGKELINSYKVLMSRPISGNLEVPPFKVISLLKVLHPKEVCTHTYLTVGRFDKEEQCVNLKKYLETKFVRFLLVQSIAGIDISKDKFRFVPLQDFSEEWTDEKLYKKYKLEPSEIEFIESMIRPME